jgi:hypothetical protein
MGPSSGLYSRSIQERDFGKGGYFDVSAGAGCSRTDRSTTKEVSMSAPFRIKRLDAGVTKVARTREDEFKSYLERLLLMIPGEVISLYMVGSGLIPEDQPIALVVWAVVCLVGVIVVRVYGTADPPNNKPTDWVHVAISTIAYVIWVYSMGGPFAEYGLYVPYIGSLLVLAWTFFVPIFYKGPAD